MIVVAIGTVKLQDGQGQRPTPHSFCPFDFLHWVESHVGEPYSAVQGPPDWGAPSRAQLQPIWKEQPLRSISPSCTAMCQPAHL